MYSGPYRLKPALQASAPESSATRAMSPSCTERPCRRPNAGFAARSWPLPATNRSTAPPSSNPKPHRPLTSHMRHAVGARVEVPSLGTIVFRRAARRPIRVVGLHCGAVVLVVSRRVMQVTRDRQPKAAKSDLASGDAHSSDASLIPSLPVAGGATGY